MGSQATAKARSIIFLVRHGECLGNVLKTNMAPEISVLTDQGKLQAKLLGELQRNVKFTQAMSSDYSRAFETAKLIISESTVSRDLPVVQNPLLREKYLGIFEGKDQTEIFTAILKSGQAPLDWCPEGAESTDDMDRRVENFLQEIFMTVDSSSDAQTILAVTHSGFILHAFKYLSSTPNKYTLKNWTPEYFKLSQNAGYFEMAIHKLQLPGEPRELEILTAHGNEHLKTLKMDNVMDGKDRLTGAIKYRGCVQQ